MRQALWKGLGIEAEVVGYGTFSAWHFGLNDGIEQLGITLDIFYG